MEPVLEETVIHQLAVLAVPLPSVVQGQQLYELELARHVVRHSRRLRPFHSPDAHSDTGFLDHVDVVGAISNRHGEMRGLALHPPHDFLLVFGGAAVADGRVQRQVRRNGLLRVEQKHLLLF